MANKQAFQAYSQAIQTTPKTRQIVMLYDGVIRFLKLAQTAIVEKRIEDRFKYLHKASQILSGLQNSLDFDSDESITKISHTLHRFYVNMNMRILAINFQRDPVRAKSLCDTLIGEIFEMAVVWKNIDKNSATDSVPAPASLAPEPVKKSEGEGSKANFSA